MTRVHPNSPNSNAPDSSITLESEPVTLTVWRKSLLFNCSGFTVFDAKGDLVFRVDNYSSSRRTEIVLMDFSGKSLFTIRRKKLSLIERWYIYEGEAVTARPRFLARKSVTVRLSGCKHKELANVARCSRAGAEEGPVYGIEGSFLQRSCVVLDDRRRNVAEVRQKEAVGGVSFGGDVFRLVVQPGFDAGLAMAMVVVLEQMFGGGRAN
ncbi:hypothetical protein HPP92_007407 [Vanilla planifolia]|uniref:Protein LURP-one-related 8 n=1 Tax=Vanilla planifolia TaxID=51239 RepID=A0A835RE50_VANPL|nr:hypothetical protein HPP92_007569 [Vanilla planifolia]KAG0490544.1 hypothetical protein HPP92_007407 [Vanilla planifolia]